MYSVVLMTALTTGSTTTDWHHRGPCGSYGGCGAGCQDSYGAGYQGCGCWGGYSNWSYCNMPPPNSVVMGGHGVAGGTVTPGTGTAVPGTGNGPEKLEKPKENKNDAKETIDPTGAKLLIELPANAKLFIDDKPVKTALGVQLFDIPALEPDKDYFYMVRIEMMRDGQPLSQTRRILVRAGQVTRTEFKELEPEAPRTARAE
jgi:uncharacterized protein (TIGR03000 family)